MRQHGGGGPSAREWRLFALGTGLVWVHVVDHLVTEPRFGWSLALVVVLFELATALAVLTLMVAVVYDRLAPSVREVAALSLGFTWLLASFVHHVGLMLIRGPAPTDFTGVSATIGGLLVVVAGLMARALTPTEPRRLVLTRSAAPHRGSGRPTGGRD